MVFSESGLREQLEFDGFTSEQVMYAIENCSADWQEQAVKAAAIYLENKPLSRQGLADQLMKDGFTEEEAEYGVKKSGY